MGERKPTDLPSLTDPNRLEALQEAGLMHTQLDEAFERLARLASRTLDAPIAHVDFLDDQRQVTRGFVAPPGIRVDSNPSPQDSFARYIAASGQPLLIKDSQASPLVASSELVSSLRIRGFLGVPIRSKEGHVLGTLSVADLVPRQWTQAQVDALRDFAGLAVTEISLRSAVRARERAEEAVQTAQEEAEQANRSKADFLSRISHELRTPMNAILGFAQILEMDVVKEDDRESIEQILKSGRHLLALIDEVLDIARIESGRFSLAIEPVSVTELFETSANLVRPSAAANGVQLHTRAAGGPEWFVWADPRRLEQVLLNLLSNAIKYNRPGGTVVLSYDGAEDGWLRLSVRDTGLGIPADKLERLFMPFDRLGAERTMVVGQGLGLALSNALVEAMGGRLGYETVEGQGSHFWVDLPRPDPKQIPGPATGAADSGSAPPVYTVLLVEDNLTNARLIAHILERRGNVRMLTAIQGRRAVELAREHHPDLVILDLNLPDIPGHEVLLRLKSDPLLRGIPVVMISGFADATQIKELLANGARAFLKKPFEIQELLQLVEESLRPRKRPV